VSHPEERILNFVVDKFPLARKKSIAVEDDLLESGIIDSLGILDLVSFLEQEFGIVVADDELVPDHFQSVAHLTRFVEHKRNEAAASRQ
jgi:acyl carrier protein